MEEQGKAVGVLTTTDLIRSQQEHPVFLISHIHRQHKAEGLNAITPQINQLALQLAAQGHRVLAISRTIPQALLGNENISCLSVDLAIEADLKKVTDDYIRWYLDKY